MSWNFTRIWFGFWRGGGGKKELSPLLSKRLQVKKLECRCCWETIPCPWEGGSIFHESCPPKKCPSFPIPQTSALVISYFSTWQGS